MKTHANDNKISFIKLSVLSNLRTKKIIVDKKITWFEKPCEGMQTARTSGRPLARPPEDQVTFLGLSNKNKYLGDIQFLTQQVRSSGLLLHFSRAKTSYFCQRIMITRQVTAPTIGSIGRYKESQVT